ncbi:carbohydrate-binding module family 43 protein [Sporormia fimetaria CBS 119925]|uniref:1,3-beta-glucanosyltransferase n=1 Tax=Sporormia fimetaria CBS 119925 TaxID=1340428 RepID=A0A6A6VCR4_9PLEO|nr:carbohydrate-binding module family 43 protein [Sporormia fimetaria CBS 119925]
MRGLTLSAAAAILAGVHAAIDPIEIKGTKFFYKSSGEQFFMKGVAYQQEINTNTPQSEDIKYVDPLADAATCKRDIKYLSDVKTNTIRVYAINPEENHDECMNALADAGIYVIADLSQPGLSINRDAPEWDTRLYERYTSVVDVMAKYDNTLGFFAGNEVSNQPNNTMASAFVKAAVRDTKAYIKSKNYRQIGVGYATNDDAEIRDAMAAYFACGDDADRIDFWGYNIYSWCGESSFEESGFDVRTKEFEKYPVPVFFAEYGCNEVRPRLFTEVGALYGSQMTGVWSGGIVYMYFEEANKYGLVTVDGDEVTTNEDFENLKSEISKVKPTGVKRDAYNPPSNSAPECPKTDKTWTAKSDSLPPPANAKACSCMMETLGCVVNEDELDEENYGELFGTVCGLEDGEFCAGINNNATAGPYGAYSMCEPKQKLSFALNAYHKKYANGCDFEGQAKTTSAKASSEAECKDLVEQAGPEGTGTIAAPSGDGNGNGNGNGPKKEGAASGLTVPTLMGFASVLAGMAVVLA